MINDKKELENLEQVNASFIKSIRDVIEPFVKKLEAIHKNKVELNEDEYKNLKHSIDVIKIYSSKEASVSKFLNNRTEKSILDDINYELAIVMRIAKDAENGKLEQVYTDCEELKANLIKLEEDILRQKKLAA